MNGAQPIHTDTQQPDMLDRLLQRMSEAGDAVALVTGDQTVTFSALLQEAGEWVGRLDAQGVVEGDVVMLKGGFSLPSVSALIALLCRNAVVILLAPGSWEKEAEFAELGEAQWIVHAQTQEVASCGRLADHPLYEKLRERGEAGLVLFSSGSTGVSKATVHSVPRLLRKFAAPGKRLRTLAFLLFDHIAGMDTLFYSLFNGSTLVLPGDRSPDAVCALIAAHGVEVLPTAPSFLNLLLLSGAHARHDLSSLKIITYGSEMMPAATLERCADAFPQARLIQKYGTSEIGALPSRSEPGGGTWVRIGGPGYHWRVVDGLLEVKADTAMLGYLNAPSPFTPDGYFRTGDAVEVDGERLRFLGRDSDIISVGGQKVFPAEVENLIRAMPDVEDVAVYGEPHAILGAAVVARIRPAVPGLTIKDVRLRVRQALAGTVEPYKIPQKYVLTDAALTTARGKQIRRAQG